MEQRPFFSKQTSDVSMGQILYVYIKEIACKKAMCIHESNLLHGIFRSFYTSPSHAFFRVSDVSRYVRPERNSNVLFFSALLIHFM